MQLYPICQMRTLSVRPRNGNIMVSQLFLLFPATLILASPVPSLQPAAERESLTAALSLFICGCIASEKYSLLSTR